MSTSLTGTKTIPLDHETTDRQYQIYQEDLLRKEFEREKKDKFRADLEQQMQAKIFKREKDRLFIDEKSLVTNKNILKQIGGISPDKHREDQTDLKKIEHFERHVDSQVRNMQRIAQNMWKDSQLCLVFYGQ